jgi:hypothetical protein
VPKSHESSGGFPERWIEMGEKQVPSIVETLLDCDAKTAKTYLEVLQVLKAFEGYGLFKTA